MNHSLSDCNNPRNNILSSWLESLVVCKNLHWYRNFTDSCPVFKLLANFFLEFLASHSMRNSNTPTCFMLQKLESSAGLVRACDTSAALKNECNPLLDLYIFRPFSALDQHLSIACHSSLFSVSAQPLSPLVCLWLTTCLLLN